MEIAMIIVKALTAMVGWTAFAVIVAIAALTFLLYTKTLTLDSIKDFLNRRNIGVESLNFRVL